MKYIVAFPLCYKLNILSNVICLDIKVFSLGLLSRLFIQKRLIVHSPIVTFIATGNTEIEKLINIVVMIMLNHDMEW